LNLFLTKKNKSVIFIIIFFQWNKYCWQHKKHWSQYEVYD